jgi:hypothetical protein
MRYKGWSKDVNQTIIALLVLVMVGFVLIKLR